MEKIHSSKLERGSMEFILQYKGSLAAKGLGTIELGRLQYGCRPSKVVQWIKPRTGLKAHQETFHRLSLIPPLHGLISE